MSVAVTLTLGVVFWVLQRDIDDRLSERVMDLTRYRIALAYRDHMAGSHCDLTKNAITLASARSTLAKENITFAALSDDDDWRINFDGDANHQATVSIYAVDSSDKVIDNRVYALPAPGGLRSRQFLDAVYADRVCP